MVSTWSAREVSQPGGGATTHDFIVFIDTGAPAIALRKVALASLAKQFRAHLITFDTNQELLLADGRNAGEAFEFSGYQWGLEEALRASLARSGDVLRILFLNGTAFTSHLPLSPRLFLSQAFGEPTSDGPPRLRGLVQSCGVPTRAVATRGFYLPTFALHLAGKAEDVARLRFYDPSALGTRALAARYASAGHDYDRMVTEWLSPTSPFRGWYKATPGQPLDEVTAYRKRVAIYLEHSLPGWMERQGVNVSMEPLIPRLAQIGGYMLADRVFVNLLKIRFRVGRYLRGTPASRA